MSSLSINGKLISNTDLVIDGAEVKTGMTFEGKPVYAKRFGITLSSDTTPKTYAHGIADISYIIDIRGYATTSSPEFYPVQWYNGGAYFAVHTDRTNIILRTSLSGLYGRGAVITLYYTKTTD